MNCRLGCAAHRSALRQLALGRIVAGHGIAAARPALPAYEMGSVATLARSSSACVVSIVRSAAPSPVGIASSAVS